MLAEGRQEIRAFFKDIVAGLLRDMSHTVHNQKIAIEGDRASAPQPRRLLPLPQRGSDLACAVGMTGVIDSP